jgi:NAD(P)-dependent dehydrogenase (short-subunit alcohol dehydrogenase family)
MDLSDSNFGAIGEAARKAGGDADGRKGNVTKPADVEAVMEAAESRFGPIDVLLNAAGIFQARKFLEYSLDEWRAILDVNVTRRSA